MAGAWQRASATSNERAAADFRGIYRFDPLSARRPSTSSQSLLNLRTAGRRECQKAASG